MTSLRKRRRSGAGSPLITRDDLAFLLRLPLLAAVALLVPERKWHAFAYRLESAARWLNEGRIQRTLRGLMLGSGLARPDPLWVLANQTEQTIGILRECITGWSPKIVLQGEDHLEAVHRQGHGAVLWIAHFCFNSLVGKMALAQAGHAAHHVSRPEHGFTKSRFGMRVLNPLRVAAELRYLKGRVVVDRDRPAASMVEALQILKRNGLVSITAGAWEGTLIVSAGIGRGEIELATGAPRLALLAAAPLIPVFVVRDDVTGVFSVVVEAPITAGAGADRDAVIAQSVEAFLRRHARYLAANPYQWRDWEKLTPAADTQHENRDAAGRMVEPGGIEPPTS